MPVFDRRVPSYKPRPPETVSWDSFRGGLNTLLNPTEIRGDELARADNLILEGLGIPTKRWGYLSYFMAGATGQVRAIGSYYNGSTNELLALTDGGFLTKKSNASYTMITGASWPSGYDATMTQLNNKVYIVSPGRELVRYNGSALVGFPTLATPITSGITNLSTASGLGELTTVSYRISAEGKVGETLASTAISLVSVQADHTLHRVRVTWTTVSAASGDLTGYVIYGRDPGNETLLSRVNADTLVYDDNGTDDPSQIVQPPTANTTGGVKAKYVVRFKDRLVYAGISGDPTRVVFSGRVPNEDKVHWSYGGGYILVDPDSGESITGLGVLRDRIIVFKEHSIWELTIGSVTIGSFTIADPQYTLLTASHGCVAHKTIAAVEDDLFFLTDIGVYAIGYKPNILNVLSTTEISAKVRDIFRGINQSTRDRASAQYKDFKYVISYPESGQTNPNKQMTFDRERNAWMGPWSIASNNLFKYYDSTNTEHLVFGSNATAYVYEESSAYETDDGQAIATTLRTRKEDFKSWNLFKTMKDVFTNMRDVSGTVNANILLEERSGAVTAAKNFTINLNQGSSGWGSSEWADSQWGDSDGNPAQSSSSEIIRWVQLNRTGRAIQIEITTTGAGSNYKLLGVRLEAQIQGKGSIPASYRV